MEMKNMVSLWIGHLDSALTLSSYLEVPYTDDGDALPSQFHKDFGLDRFDIDFSESDFFREARTDLAAVLAGFSYYEEITRKFVSKYGQTSPRVANLAILVYNHQFNGSIVEVRRGTGYVRFVGHVDYSP